MCVYKCFMFLKLKWLYSGNVGTVLVVLPPHTVVWGIMTSASTSTSTFEDVYLFVIRNWYSGNVGTVLVVLPSSPVWGIMTSASTSTSTFEDEYMFVIRDFMCFKVYVCTEVFYVFKVFMNI